MIGDIKGLIKVNKIQKSQLLQHKPIDVEGKVLPYIDAAFDGSAFLCLVSKDGTVTGLESIEKEDTDQNETILKILKGVHEAKYGQSTPFDAEFVFKKAREIATMAEDIDDIINNE